MTDINTPCWHLPLAKEVTIVIATADRVGMVNDCIRDFSPLIPRDVELLVVDAGVGERVDEAVIKEFWGNSRVLRSPRRNLCLQRNMATAAARGNFLCFVDDDAAIQPGWWPSIIRPFKDPQVGAVAGAVWSSLPPVLSDKPSGYVTRIGTSVPCNNRGAGHPKYLDYGVGANTAYRRQTLLELGGFAEIFGIYDEDNDFGLRMKTSGWKLVYAHDAPVYHHQGRVRPRVMTKQKQFLLGRNRALLLHRNYGFFSRLLSALMVLPLIRLWRAFCETVQFGWTRFGHVAAYWAGMCKGVWEGRRDRGA
jgi:glycosyltransferase involved in cell wall biosynthesis